MSFFYKLLPAVTLLLGLASAQDQACYYPDGLTVSTDIPCNNNAEVSSCCPSDSFCMSNGLCYNAGVTSRGSCTDANWTSEECASYCTTTSTSATVYLQPCDASTNTFTCGLNNTSCEDKASTFEVTTGTAFVLRESQVAALIDTSTASGNASGKTYTAGAMAGLGMGIGLPLSFALLLALLVLRKEREKNRPKLMYKPADEPGVPLSAMRPIHLNRNESTTTFGSTQKPNQPMDFTQRNEYYKNPFTSERDLNVPVYEIGSSSPPYSEEDRVEAPDKRFSK